MYILPQYLANLIQLTSAAEKPKVIIFVPVLRTLSSLGLKILQRFCTFLSTLVRFSCAKNGG